MSEDVARNVLKVAMAQICQNLGWHAVQTSPMDILVDILQRYLRTVARVTHQYAEHYNRIEPNLNDLALAFKEMGISLGELEEYVNNVEPVPFIHSVPKFPVPHDNQFNFPKENSREVSLRPEWIHPHLPYVYPEALDEELPPSPTEVNGKGLSDGSFLASDIGSPSGSPKLGSRRPLEIAQDSNFPSSKRPRLLSDEEGRPVREVVSVSMTPAGLISPYREGRLPDTCTPLKGFEDSRPNSPVVSEAEDSPPASVGPVVEPPLILPPVIPPEVKVKKSKMKDGTKHKIKKDNKENKKKDSKESKSKKEKALKAQQKVKDKLTKLKLAKAKKLKNYKLPKIPKVASSSLDPAKHRKLGRPKKTKSDLGFVKVKSEPVDKGDVPKMTAEEIKMIKRGLKTTKSRKVEKAPKADKTIPGGQLANLLAKASSSGSGKSEKFINPDFLKSCERDPYSRPSGSSTFSPMNFYDQRSSESFPPVNNQRNVSGDFDHHANSSNSSLNFRSDSEEIPSFQSKIKLEPKDVYDFTDDEDNRNAAGASDESRERRLDTPVPPVRSVEHVVTSPVPPPEIARPVLTSPDAPAKRKRGRPPKIPKKEPPEPSSLVSNPRPRTPEPYERLHGGGVPHSHGGSMLQQQRSPFSSVSNFEMSPINSQMPYFHLANIPPALLPSFSMTPFSSGANSQMNMGGGGGGAGGQVGAGSGGMAQYPKLVDLADVAISKAQHDGDFDLGRSKEKDKSKRRVEKKRDKKDKEKQKLKKKKDKSKDKNSEKAATSSSGKSEKVRDKVKSKKSKSGDGSSGGGGGSSSKSKEKRDKGEKSSKDKKRDKSRDKEKKLEKKKERPPKLEKDIFKDVKKEMERSPSPTAAAIPRLTFKLGSGTESENPKIVIKGLSNTDSPSSSPLPYASDRSPPGSLPPLLLPPPSLPQQQQPAPSLAPQMMMMMPTRPIPGGSNAPSGGFVHGKPHSKAHSKVQQAPPSIPPQQQLQQHLPPPTPSAPPARTVITETVGTIIDASGNKIWICPACTHPDDGSPMIGCDDCDEWYHWVCVGIVVPPNEDENWFCSRCIAKQQTLLKKRRYRKDN